VLLHRVAEATVKDFLDRVGEAITDHAKADGETRRVGHEGGGEANAR
jgi:hypothetical protein